MRLSVTLNLSNIINGLPTAACFRVIFIEGGAVLTNRAKHASVTDVTIVCNSQNLTTRFGLIVS